VIDPFERTVAIHELGTAVELLDVDRTLTGGLIVPGFACMVGELFEGLAPRTRG
jgi:pantothenate kinase type III